MGSHQNLKSEKKTEPQTKITKVDPSSSDPKTDQILTNSATDPPFKYVLPKKINRYFHRKRWRETGVPIINLIIGILALLVILSQAIIYNQQRRVMNRQSAVMEKQTKVSEESLRVSQRAYVGVADLNADIRAGGQVLILLENIGHTPAKSVSVEANVYTATPAATTSLNESGELINDKILGKGQHWDAGTVTLFPGNLRMRVTVPIPKLTAAEAAAILNKKEILYVAGTIKYEDGFGTNDTTTFAFQYSPRPNEGWTVHSGLSKIFGK